ncbi:DoxX family protein [Propionicicella superfundia]|uniref:DoxX family protein n=1 Tax=Propionicicella superfundia TaxID=348582 RepID=UPI000421143A|nr:DoxX family membrane protein [Propionicicella superfundia]
MTFLRATARTMLASFFVVTGVNAIRKPDAYVAEVDPVAKRALPLAQRVVPPAAAVHLPADTRTWVRVFAGAQVAGGVMLASGVGRRVGAGILTGTMLPQVAATNPFTAPDGQRREVASHLLRNVALLGGVLLATLDTEGKPGLAWRLGDARKDVAGEIDDASRKASAAVEKAGDAARKAGKKAVKAGRSATREAKRAGKRVQETLS